MGREKRRARRRGKKGKGERNEKRGEKREKNTKETATLTGMLITSVANFCNIRYSLQDAIGLLICLLIYVFYRLSVNNATSVSLIRQVYYVCNVIHLCARRVEVLKCSLVIVDEISHLIYLLVIR